MTARAEAATRRRSVIRRRPVVAAIVAVVAVAVLLLVVAVFEGDFPEGFADVGLFARFLLRHYGAPGAVALLYVEETGVPLPVPGDVYVAFLGRLAGGDTVRWLGAWLAIIAAVVAGSTNLYLIGRRWGRQLIERPLGAALHLDPHRVEAAERWFTRWGALAIIFGRHVPGLRVPITVVASISGVPYRVFAPSVAVSTAAWAALWLWLGAHYGHMLARFIDSHRWTLAGVAIVIILLAASTVVRAWRRLPSGSGTTRSAARP